jgi:hypothetical protein
MKIVYCIDHLRPDGTQHVLIQLAKGLAARGHQQVVVCLNDSWDAQLLAELQQWAAVRVLGKWSLLSGFGLATLWIWLRREHFDVLVTLLFAADVIGRTVARLLPRCARAMCIMHRGSADWFAIQCAG